MATPRKKTPSEMALQSAIKAERARVRLEHSIMGDYVLNDSIPVLIEDHSALEGAGKQIQVSVDFAEGVKIRERKTGDKKEIS